MPDSLFHVYSPTSSLSEELVAYRRDFHQHAELSRKEARTAKRICEILDELDIPYRTGIAGHGIVAEIPAQKTAPYIALRADMDALPIQEETGLEFSSLNKGVMHACGHDGHMAMLLGAARLLVEGEQAPLPIRLIFQPAEELGEGAREMIAAGVLENVAMIFGGHIDRHYKPGTIVISDGAISASTDHFSISISGQASHGARPHESVDAVVVGSLMVMALQTIVSREIDPAHPSVISVGEFTAGTAASVIAGQARLSGTIRALDAKVRSYLADAVERIARSVGDLHGANIEVSFGSGTPPVINDPACAAIARETARAIVGPDSAIEPRSVNMAGEDFSYYLNQVPGCFVRYGAQVLGKESYPAHSSKFDFDERALGIGAAYLSSVARRAAEVLV